MLPLHSPFEDELIATARALALTSPEKGILSADETPAQMEKRFAAGSVENTEENRRRYRQVMFQAPGLAENISGMILSHEAFYQQADDGRTFGAVLRDAGIMPGITVDMGHKEHPSFPGETYTQGLIDLDTRAAKYREDGARFAKWRAVLKIQDGRISPANIHENAWMLARYASICQWSGLVPVIEPEILSNGDHSIEVCAYWTEQVFAEVYKALRDNNVLLEGTVVKTSVVVPGNDWKGSRSFETNARMTLRAYRRVVPPAVPSVHFLTGTQTVEESTLNLNAISRQSEGQGWVLSFSFARGLQEPCITTWRGRDENIAAAQAALTRRAKAHGLARSGAYTGYLMDEAAHRELIAKGYSPDEIPGIASPESAAAA